MSDKIRFEDPGPWLEVEQTVKRKSYQERNDEMPERGRKEEGEQY